jgi:hypothetical protein
VALGLLLLAAPASAAGPDAAGSAREAVGGTLVQLAAHPAVGILLRGAARGRQQIVYEGLRLPGPPVALADGRWLVGWSCGDPAPERGCVDRGLFMAFDAEGERLFLMLVEAGAPVYLAPPRTAHWPAALVAPFSDFAPGLPHGPTFDLR